MQRDTCDLKKPWVNVLPLSIEMGKQKLDILQAGAA